VDGTVLGDDTLLIVSNASWNPQDFICVAS